jgi:hypothetical protein
MTMARGAAERRMDALREAFFRNVPQDSSRAPIALPRWASEQTAGVEARGVARARETYKPDLERAQGRR